MDFTEKFISRESQYNGRIIDVSLDRVELPGGANSFREVVTHPGGVTVIPVDGDGYVYCVRQYRYPVSETIIETPAGKLEKGEDPALCAVRELSEETGIRAERLVFLGSVYPSPGFCRETLYIYMATGLSYERAHPDENEFLEPVRIHIDELINLVMSGEIKDAKTIIAILKAKRLLEEEDGKNHINS